MSQLTLYTHLFIVLYIIYIAFCFTLLTYVLLGLINLLFLNGIELEKVTRVQVSGSRKIKRSTLRKKIYNKQVAY